MYTFYADCFFFENKFVRKLSRCTSTLQCKFRFISEISSKFEKKMVSNRNDANRFDDTWSMEALDPYVFAKKTNDKCAFRQGLDVD